MLVLVPASRDAIEAIGAREGWLTRFCDPAPLGGPSLFHLIAFWVENRVMVELVPQDKIGEYEEVPTLEWLDAMQAARGK
jgi:hypothetical protein